jgi:hypothetical protein
VGALNQVFQMLRTNAPAESSTAVMQGVRDGSFTSPHLKLLNPQPPVQRVLSTTGMDMFLEIHPTLDRALASFQGSQAES